MFLIVLRCLFNNFSIILGVDLRLQGPFWYHFLLILGDVFDRFDLFLNNFSIMLGVDLQLETRLTNELKTNKK